MNRYLARANVILIMPSYHDAKPERLILTIFPDLYRYHRC